VPRRPHRLLAHQEGQPWKHAAAYADRHYSRVIPPVAAISLGTLGRSLRVRHAREIVAAIARIRKFGEYV
jgi:hypothetical protein